MSTILIKNAKIITMDQDDQILDRADILIEKNLIKKISSEPIKSKADKIIDVGGKLVLPGLINAHTHAAMTLLRGYSDNLNLDKWLEKIWQKEAQMTAEDIYWGTMLAQAEMIRNGISCFLDMYWDFPNVSQAVIDSGMRAMNSYCLMDLDRPRVNLSEVIKVIDQWQNQGEGRLKTIFGPHAPYTCSGLLLREVASLARKNKIALHIHLAETKKEINDFKRKYQTSPVELLAKYEFFSQNKVIAAHSIWLSDRDINILKNNKVSIATCPSSNLKLASGICPAYQLSNNGLNVALGTDGPASNNALDILAEAKQVSLLAKYFSQDASVLSPQLALKMATINGAKALGWEKEIGSIEVGKYADIIIIDNRGSNYLPEHDVVSNLIYAGHSSDVETVIINGKIVMENKKIIVFDEEKVKREFGKRVKRLFN